MEGFVIWKGREKCRMQLNHNLKNLKDYFCMNIEKKAQMNQEEEDSLRNKNYKTEIQTEY